MPVLTTTLYKPSNKTGLPLSPVEKKKMFCEVAKQLITCVVLYSQSPEPANECIPNDIFREHLSYTVCPCYCATLPSYKTVQKAFDQNLIRNCIDVDASDSPIDFKHGLCFSPSSLNPLPPNPPKKNCNHFYAFNLDRKCIIRF